MHLFESKLELKFEYNILLVASDHACRLFIVSVRNTTISMFPWFFMPCSSCG